jgi:hypothetical protein
MTYKKKLIEVALPLEAINKEAAREKSIRHGHPSTLHLWWARRPLAACRAVLFASLVDDPSEYVAELLKDSAKRKAAEKELKARKKLWDEMSAVLEKAKAGGISAPAPGPEPKLEEIIAEMERERLFGIIRELVKWENSNNERVLNAARYEIARSVAPPGVTPPTKPDEVLAFLGKHAPPVYDPFCGGGSIPLEAQRLGLEAHASDLNPVPVLINKALIEIPPKFAGKPPVNPEAKKKLGASGSWKGAAGLAEDIRYYGQWMRDEAEKRIGHLYPKVKLPKELGGSEATVIAWLWARTVASPNPAAKGAHVPLVKSFWLSTKPGKKAWVEPVVDQNSMTYRFEVRTGNGEPRNGTVSRNGGICLLTNSPMPLDYIRAEGKAGRMGARLMAIVADGKGGRIYLPPTDEHERIALSASSEDAPETDLPAQALGFRVQNYGMTKHRHLFTNRQLVALTTLCGLISEARTAIRPLKNGFFSDGIVLIMHLRRVMCERPRISTRSCRPRQRFRPPPWRFCARCGDARPAAGGSPRSRQTQARHPQQIVGAGHKVAPRLCPFSPPISAPPQAAHCLDPADDFFHPLPDFLAEAVTRFRRRASVQAGDVHALLARHMRRNVLRPTRGHKVFPVIRLVRAHGFHPHPGVQFLVGLDLPQRHHRLRFGDGVVQCEVGAQTIAVFHQEVPAKTQLGFFAIGLPIEHALGVGRALVRVVAPGFAAKVDRRVAGVFVLGGLHFRGVRTVFADEAFQAGPRFDEGAVNGEVLVAGPAVLAREVIDLGEEEPGHVGGEHALIVLGEDAVVEAALAQFAVEEPEPEQIVAELLAEEPFAAHAVKGGEDAGLEQLLGRDAGAAVLLVKGVEEGRELFQNRIHVALDGAQRMVGGHSGVEVEDGEKLGLGLGLTAHAFQTPLKPSCSKSRGTFSTAC